MSNKQTDIVREQLFEELKELKGIWYDQSETIEEAIAKTRGPFGSWRKGFAELLGYHTGDGYRYRKLKEPESIGSVQARSGENYPPGVNLKDIGVE